MIYSQYVQTYMYKGHGEILLIPVLLWWGPSVYSVPIKNDIKINQIIPTIKLL